MSACQLSAIAALLLECLVLDQEIVSSSDLGKKYGDLKII